MEKGAPDSEAVMGRGRRPPYSTQAAPAKAGNADGGMVQSLPKGKKYL
jgi:hypothetical protein